MAAFGLISDQHFHQWSKFNSINPDGVSERLQYQLDELRRCADEVKAAGGSLIINAGDTFHVRGSVSPSVLNPVLDLHEQLIKEGFEILVLAGNHDIEGRDSSRLSNAAAALEKVGCKVVSTLDSYSGSAGRFLMVPWVPSVKDLKEKLESCKAITRSEYDLILHAPIDGFMPGLPDHGLTGEYLAGLGFKRVFSGHYHSTKEIVPGKVWSIGASTHQTWGDAGSKAGFLIVSDEGVTWRKSHAPEFIQLDGDESDEDIAAKVPGNYVRAFIDADLSAKDTAKLRNELEGFGAKGVVLVAHATAKAARESGATTITKGETLEQSVSNYVQAQSFAHEAAVADLCQQILAEARMGAVTE